MSRGVRGQMAPGVRNKFGAPMFEPEVFRKQMYCFEKSAYDIVVTWFGARELCSLAPSLRLWCYAIKIGNFSENTQIFNAERHELLFHEHLQFSNTIGLPHGSCTDCQQRLLAAFQVSSCSFCVTSNPAPRDFSAWMCVCFANNKTFPTFNKLLF